MIVTMAMIYDGLSKRFECVKGPQYEPGYPVIGAFQIADGFSRNANYNACYVCCDVMKIWEPGVPRESIIFGSLEPSRDLSCGLMVIGLSDPVVLRGAVAQVIDSYVNWANDLLDLNLHGACLEEMVDYAHGLFGNPITVIDHNYQVLAYSRDDCMDDDLWVTVNINGRITVEKPRMPADSIEEAGFEKYLEDLQEKGALYNYATVIGSLLTACLVRNSASGLVAVNIIQKNRPVTEGDLDCLKYFGKILNFKMKAIEIAWQDASGSYIALLHDVVRGNLVEASDFKARISEKCIHILPKFTVLIVISRSGLLKYHQLCQVEDDLAEILPEGKSVIHARTLVTFINHDKELNTKVLDVLEGYSARNGLVVGVSESRGADFSLHNLVCEAQIALRVGRRCYPERNVLDFDDCRRYYLLDLCSRRNDWRRYLHPCLMKIAEHDATAVVPLMPTLECLAANFGNKKTTAKDLAIQRNTLQYRIEKIEQLCSIDLSDEEAFDHIVASIALRDYCEVQSK